MMLLRRTSHLLGALIVITANKAIKYLTRILSERKSKIIQQREEKRERKLAHAEELRQRKEAAARTERLLEYMKEQQLLKSRADEALQLLWTRHNKRTQAANTIARWWHDILICRSTLSYIPSV